tara:strand:+ start:610 stop:777 length:168 start_codon:yes stop_codon:yes gene_type:complete
MNYIISKEQVDAITLYCEEQPVPYKFFKPILEVVNSLNVLDDKVNIGKDVIKDKG